MRAAPSKSARTRLPRTPFLCQVRRSGPRDGSRAGGPCPQRFEGGRLAGVGEPVAAAEPVTAGRQQAKGPAHVAGAVDGPADVVLARWLTGPAFPEPLFGGRLPHGRLDLGI